MPIATFPSESLEVTGVGSRRGFAIVCWYTDGDSRSYSTEACDFLRAASEVGMRDYCCAIKVPVEQMPWRNATLLKPWVAKQVYERWGRGPNAKPILFLDADARLLRDFKARDLPRVRDVGWRVRKGENLSGTLLLRPGSRVVLSFLEAWEAECRKAWLKKPPYVHVWGDQQLMQKAADTVGLQPTCLPREWCFVDKIDGECPAGVVVYHTQASRRRRRM